MEFRLAAMKDLPQIKSMYQHIVADLQKHNLTFWDEVYPRDFFEEDIQQNRLYVLLDHGDLLSAFALTAVHPGSQRVTWKNNQAKALYLERLGVHVAHARKGIASFMLANAMALAKQRGTEYLRLFVIDDNAPAIAVYERNGFARAEGIYRETIDMDGAIVSFQEYGYEIAL